MRSTLVFVLLALSLFSFGQSNRTESLFLTTRFEAAIVVRKHSMGADLVEISILKPTYSHQLLRDQIAFLGKELNVEPRGVAIVDYQLDRSDAETKIVKASFGIDGLIDASTGTLHLTPLVRAMSLAKPPDSLNALMIQFEKFIPNGNTLRSCGPAEGGCSGAIVQGVAGDKTFGVEYRVKLLTHNPSEIHFPDSPSSTVSVPKSTPPTTKTDWLLITLLLVASASVGALVYSLLLAARPRVPR